MTINNSSSKVIALGDGATTVFDFGFVGDQAGYISVIYTDAGGNETTLTQGNGPTEYQIELNAAVSPGLWGIGGTVTYAPSSTPIAVGTTLTIYRELPLVQNTSLLNLSSISALAQSTETGLDQLEMQIQQIDEAQTRVISAPIVDPDTINLTLPAAAQRANQVLGFDGSGDVIAVSSLPSGTVSTAMQPVVNAASLAAGRTAFGLGSAAVLNPNLGLQEGVTAAENLDVNFATDQDATNQTVTSAFHLTQRFASGSITYSLPAGSTLWNGFGFWAMALTGSITFAINGSDGFAGMSSGQSLTIRAGTSCFITTNGATNATWWVRNVQRAGFNAPSNLQINAAASSDILNVALKDGSGNDPSTSSPILVAFRDPTPANGDPQVLAITSALSIAAPDGATLGSSNGIAFRYWLVLFNNGGTPVLGLINCSTASRIYPLNEAGVASSTAMSAGATSAGVFYTPTGTSVSNVAFRIIGYLTYESGLGTAGVYTSNPTVIQLFGPGIKKPGDPVGSAYASTGTEASGTNTYTASNTAPTTANSNLALSAPAYIPASAANIISVRAQAVVGVNAAMVAWLYNGSANVATVNAGITGQASPAGVAMPLRYRAIANSVNSVTYSLYYAATATATLNGYSSSQFFGGTANTYIEVEEIMG